MCGFRVSSILPKVKRKVEMVGSVISTVKPKLPKVVPNIRSFQIEQQPFYVCISLEALFYASTYHKNSTPCKKKKKITKRI